ncbi:helix-turn-helix domain-containing protein [Blautia sp. HCP3S3_H10_1]|uniref:helix-turn-helix domain-containing protein n=1 Tax=unclassified Blautia TaxID=2648079 RepID=UPI003F91D3E1|nr:AraC family transcriptional regulator [Clostridia bacterium]
MIELSQLRHAYPERTLYIDRQHGHPEYTFLHFFTSMKLTYNGKSIITEPHSVIIFRPGTPQHFESDTPMIHDWIHFHGDMEPILQNISLELDTLYYPSQTEFITDLTRELETEFYNARANRDALIQLKFQELFIKLDRAVSGESEPVFDTEITEKFRRLRGKMFISLQEKWSVERMAAEVGFSKSRFYNIYKSIYGITPTADLIEARVNSARNMLLSTSKKIEDISYLLGYENTTHFIRQFKKWTGYSPAAYRKRERTT